MTQSTYFNQVKNVLKVLQGYTKGIRFLLVMLLTLCVSAEVWAEEEVYKTAKFGSSYNSESISSYTASWSATNNNFTINITNANNNSNKWTYIKMGRKNYTSVGTITTKDAIDKAVTKVTLTIDALTVNKINNITLYTSTSSSGSYISVGTFAKESGAQSVTLTNPAANLYYKIEVDCASGTSNGLITISQVDYYIESSTPAVPVDPEVTFSDGEYTVGGAALNLSTLLTTNSTGAVTYSITNAGTTGATINGTSFTATAAGTCTVQASQAATASHNAITKTATITVNAPAGGGEALSYTWDLSKKTYSAASNIQVTWSATDVNMVADKGTAGTAPNNYLGGDANNRTSSRFYQNSILTITPEANVTITSVVFTATSTNYATALKGSTWTNATASANNTTVTVTPTDGTTAISAKIGGTCGFTGVTVNYTKAASDEPEPVIVKTLKSIAVTGMTTTFEQGDVFKFDGTCTATYSVTKDDVAQADETAEVTPAYVSTPDMNQIGTQTVYVTYSEGGVEKTNEYEITITENTVTAGEYCIIPNNDFWRTNFSGSITSDALNQTYTSIQDDITIQYAKGSGSNLYINASQTRTYNGTILTFSVPSGYVITAIAFTADGDNWAGTHTANAGSMTDSKNWAGSANEVTITFGGTCRITNICVTYEAIDLTLPSAPTFNPEAGTYNAVQNVTISAEAGTTIYYTLDGTEPTKASAVYSTPIEFAETKTLKAIAVKDEKVSLVASATYTINLPLTTIDQIFAKATAVGSTATSVEITFDNWVVSAVKEDGKTAFVTDGTKGFAIFDKDLNLGFSVGNILSGTVACEVQLYNGFAELTALTSATTGLNVTTGGTITTQELDATAIEALTGVNTGSLIKINGICSSTDLKYYVAGVQIYTSLYDFGTLEVDVKYNITGIYQQYHSTKEMLPRSAEDIEEIQEPLTTYNVNWLVNGDEWADSESVKEGTKITSLPEDPTDECGGKTFVGWSNQEVTDGNKPAVLFKDVANSPTIAANTTFHAVFADKEGDGESGWQKVIATDEVVDGGIFALLTYDEAYYLANAQSTSNPSLQTVTKQDGKITVTDEMKWRATAVGGGFTFTSYNNANYYLWGAHANDGIRINTESTKQSPTNVWSIELSNDYGVVLYHNASDEGKKYLSTYGDDDWRNYLISNIDEDNRVANLYKEYIGTTYSDYTTSCLEKLTYTVTWMVNGKEYTEGTPSTTVYADERVATLPTPPEPNAYCGDVFVGWTTENPASGNFNEAPTIYNEQSAFPPATDNQTFYAVFADYEN